MLPELTFCYWDGDPDERFTPRDMNRIAYNVNMVAREADISEETFIECARDQQFRYDEAQKVESLTYSIASSLGITVGIRSWSYGGPLSWTDFERMESNLFQCYQALGGVGERIPANRYKRVVSATLFPDAWAGTPPHIDLDVPMAHNDSELVMFVPHTATLEQRMAEINGRIVIEPLTDRMVRVRFTGARPKVMIPVRIARGGLTTIENRTLDKDEWTGSGPWTQSVTVSSAPENVMAGMSDTMTNAQSKEYAKAGIYVSAVNGTTVTLTALFVEPTIDIPIGIYYDTGSVV